MDYWALQNILNSMRRRSARRSQQGDYHLSDCAQTHPKYSRIHIIFIPPPPCMHANNVQRYLADLAPPQTTCTQRPHSAHYSSSKPHYIKLLALNYFIHTLAPLHAPHSQRSELTLVCLLACPQWRPFRCSVRKQAQKEKQIPDSRGGSDPARGSSETS